MVVSAGLVAVASTAPEPAMLVWGLMIGAVATALAMLAPWGRAPVVLLAVVQLLDVVAVGFLREASPPAGLGLLWTFPVMWAAWVFGTAGACLSVAFVSLTYWGQGVVNSGPVSLDLALVFPATVAVLAAVTTVVGRLTSSQRTLLERQSVALRAAMARAHRQEALGTDVLDAVDFGVVGFDGEGTVTLSNDAQQRLEAACAEAGPDAYGPDGFTALDPDDLPTARALRGETFEGALVWYCEPGSPQRRALMSTARSEVGATGEGRIVVTRDVTDEMLALRSRADLVDSVSHELRTPLTSILGYLDLASGDPALSDSTRRSLGVAERNAERLLALVTDVLSESATSRMGLDLRIRPESTDLAQVVRAAVESAQPRAAAREVSVDTSGVDPTTAVVDSHRIRQVVDNLLGNAIKYGREGGHVEVGCTAEGGHAWVVVRDDGPGIADVDLPRVFDRFFRSDGVRMSSTTGSGLGLAISRDIVRAHGGEITASSSPGTGATFVVRLPLRAPTEGPAETQTDTQTKNQPEYQPEYPTEDGEQP